MGAQTSTLVSEMKSIPSAKGIDLDGGLRS
jgi:hypothetical protein